LASGSILAILAIAGCGTKESAGFDAIPSELGSSTLAIVGCGTRESAGFCAISSELGYSTLAIVGRGTKESAGFDAIPIELGCSFFPANEPAPSIGSWPSRSGPCFALLAAPPQHPFRSPLTASVSGNAVSQMQSLLFVLLHMSDNK
jgi:hypothetical protein